ncbi:PfkB family carbohydrate kinase [Treponema phagedenis]|uniref:PfkB family carbohydrate kinase n=1 Tax=Treponema phagedenis TaxID=162 RepID=UPI0015A6D518|nr:PfkB family carbohydrate kinase [Treponema phagedenis]NVP24404.1 hypothetical protein [Treponema phagedenis]
MQKNILLIGSMNMDLVVQCNTVPVRGETLLGQQFHTTPGGKGANQAYALACQGSEVYFCGAIGKDEFGTRLVKNLQSVGVHCEADKNA